MFVSAIIAAGGRSLRFGGAQPKQLVTVGGFTLLDRAVSLFLGHPRVNEVIVALPSELVANPPDCVRHASGKPLRIVEGGARRQDSVANAFGAIADASELIVIHDAARPFASPDLVERTIGAAAESGAAIAATAARDTVKQGERGVIRATLPRDTIFLAQTPQAFRRDVLRDALASNEDATDEAELAERAGHMVRLVEGEATNIKITTRDDIAVADAIASERSADAPQPGATRSAPARTGRAGIGYDLHRLVADRPLILGGVTIPFDRGLQGHSDADAVCHAIIDAILGAAGAGDIGRHFPDSDQTWRGASSIDLLRRAAEILRGTGLEVGNVDATVIAEQPKLGPHVEAMRANVARALGIAPDRVSIKGKTNEGVGEIGRGEAIAVHAVALVRSRH
jgi:2-C-methyl-D-erythritol 4-phosphate cytidylyltransferase / 2-C-methyl-D-erythritol 2,4-cyclodiphosphate synthase